MRLVITGGSDAGIEAGLRAVACAPETEVIVLVADEYPNFSICGIPYYVSGEVPDWRDLAHRSGKDLEAAGLDLRLGQRVTAIDLARRRVEHVDARGRVGGLGYDRLVVATGAVPAQAQARQP